MPKLFYDKRGELCHLYDDTNYRECLTYPRGRRRVLWDLFSRRRDYGLRMPPAGFVSSLPKYSEVYPLIDRAEWPERGQEMDAKRMWLKDKITFPSLDQNGYGYCWAYCVAGAMTTLRVLQGNVVRDKRGRISTCSFAAPIKKGANEGGWPEEALQYVEKNGAVTEEYWPNLAVSNWQTLMTQTASKRIHKVFRAYRADRESVDEAATACFNGHAATVAFMWWMHAIQGPVKWHKLDGTDHWGNEIRNSWGESRGSANRHGVHGFEVYEVTGNSGKGAPDDVIVLVDVTPGLAA